MHVALQITQDQVYKITQVNLCFFVKEIIILRIKIEKLDKIVKYFEGLFTFL